MRLHQGQIKYLRETQARKTRKNVLVPANRWGKSTLVSCMQIWHLFYKFGIAPGNRDAWLKAEYRTANIAPHSALTEPVFKTIHQIMTSSFPIRQPDGTITTNKCMIEWFYLSERTLNTPPYKQFFAFNSYIEHLSLADGADKMQGKPYGIITYDEGGRSNHLEKELNGDIMPRLFDWQGTFHLLSTPDTNSASILYHYQMYQEGLLGMNNTYTQEGSLRDNDFFSDEQIQSQYDLFEGDPMAPQILEGKFVFGGDNLFPVGDILAAENPELNDGVRYEEGHQYVIGIDTAIGHDEMVYTVMDITEKPYKIVRVMAAKGNSKSPQRHLNDFLDLLESYHRVNNVNIILETWNGESARFYQDLPYWVQAFTRCYGSWQPEKPRTENKNPIRTRTNDIKKADILIALQKLLAAKELQIPQADEKLKQQLSIYKEKDDKIPTDRVMSLALASWQASQAAQNYQALNWVAIE